MYFTYHITSVSRVVSVSLWSLVTSTMSPTLTGNPELKLFFSLAWRSIISSRSSSTKTQAFCSVLRTTTPCNLTSSSPNRSEIAGLLLQLACRSEKLLMLVSEGFAKRSSSSKNCVMVFRDNLNSSDIFLPTNSLITFFHGIGTFHGPVEACSQFCLSILLVLLPQLRISHILAKIHYVSNHLCRTFSVFLLRSYIQRPSLLKLFDTSGMASGIVCINFVLREG